MSIENSLAALTAALVANAEATAGLTAAWNTLKTKADAIEKAGKADDVAAAGVPLTEKAAAKGKPVATPPVAETKPAAVATATASPSDDRDTLLALIKAKAKTHRDEVVAAMGKYGAARGSEVKDENLAACIADLQAVGAEAEDLA